MPPSAPEDGRDAALQSRLRVDQLRVRRAEIGVRRKAEGLADLRVGDVDHGGLDRPHGRGAAAHVEDGRCPAPHDRCARVGQLMQNDAAEGLGRVLHHGAQQRHRRSDAGQGHRYHLRWHAGAGQIDQILGGETTPDQRRRRTDIEHRQRLAHQPFSPLAEDGQHVQHRRQRCRAESAGDNRLVGVEQHQVQAVQVSDRLRDIAAHDRRRLGVVGREHLGHLDQPDQVRCDRRPVLPGLGVQHVDARRPWIELHRVPAVVDGGRSTSRVERELARHGLQRAPGDDLGDADDLTPRGDRGTRVLQQLQPIRRLDLDAGFPQELKRFIQDPVDEGLAQEFKDRLHVPSAAALGPRAGIDGFPGVGLLWPHSILGPGRIRTYDQAEWSGQDEGRIGTTVLIALLMRLC